ncbi:hypothetical protein POVCU2_0005480 [Plasmodium ovale curtisi]|uniref:Uncharacterized protein n=1 Tax=Plasmodium ovale curtisi TaxID=864141 RepID=A0A1A8VN95_PLAOA|nr:hypothetical protein POVCU2_0005480 [Plasmodium ovale curtisi]SBS81121.1 hypothetical protein POVCU1_004810 [Plasmodium ovale curtisi]
MGKKENENSLKKMSNIIERFLFKNALQHELNCEQMYMDIYVCTNIICTLTDKNGKVGARDKTEATAKKQCLKSKDCQGREEANFKPGDKPE